MVAWAERDFLSCVKLWAASSFGQCGLQRGLGCSGRVTADGGALTVGRVEEHLMSFGSERAKRETGWLSIAAHGK